MSLQEIGDLLIALRSDLVITLGNDSEGWCEQVQLLSIYESEGRLFIDVHKKGEQNDL